MNHVLKKLLGVGVLIASTALTIPAASSIAAPPETNPPHPMGIRGGANVNGIPEQAGTKPARTTSNGISYHGGPIMAGTVNVYIIWYGNWTTSSNASLKQTIITDFLTSVGGSPYYNINTTYAGINGAVSNVAGAAGAVSLGAQLLDTGSQGKTNLSDASIGAIVSAAITGNKLPADANGVYFVLTSNDVTKTGFLTNYCGWHTHAPIGSADIKYSFVGDPTGPSIGSCAAQTVSPNGDPGADAMVSVIAHELEETTTDPDLNAWYDSRGMENADKCAWTFGTTSTTSGANYNMTLGRRKFLIQQNWVNAGGGSCRLSY